VAVAEGIPEAWSALRAGEGSAAVAAACRSACAAFSAPEPPPADPLTPGCCLAVPFSIASATWAADSPGYRARISAATPATSAADMSVVEIVA
jgi:hypothetical protein